MKYLLCSLVCCTKYFNQFPFSSPLSTENVRDIVRFSDSLDISISLFFFIARITVF